MFEMGGKGKGSPQRRGGRRKRGAKVKREAGIKEAVFIPAPCSLLLASRFIPFSVTSAPLR
jgi:hypothetical protein